MKFGVKVKIKIPKRELKKTLDQKFDSPLGRAAHFMAGFARQMVSTPYPPASSAYNPPHLRTGTLRTGIKAERLRKKLTYVVSAFAKPKDGTGNYALDLEFGTRNMRARPFLRPMITRTFRSLNIFFKGAF